jgi:hypothetical protein
MLVDAATKLLRPPAVCLITNPVLTLKPAGRKSQAKKTIKNAAAVARFGRRVSQDATLREQVAAIQHQLSLRIVFIEYPVRHPARRSKGYFDSLIASNTQPQQQALVEECEQSCQLSPGRPRWQNAARTNDHERRS